MIRLMFSLALAIAITVTSATAMARSRHRGVTATHAPVTHSYNRCSATAAGPYVGFTPCNDPNAVFVAGTYAGSDPDPNIRAALIREFGRRKF
jgi:hypothetical protein